MDWFIWLFGGLSVLFTIVPGFLYFNDEEQIAINLLIGWWGGVATLAIIAAAMSFVIKPMLNWGLTLIF